MQSVVNESVGGDRIVALSATTPFDAWKTFAGQDPEKAAAVLSAALGALHSDLSDADAVKERYASLTGQQRLGSVMGQATALANLIAHGRAHIGLKGGADPDWYQAYAGSTGPQAQASGSGLRDGGHSDGDDPLRDGSGHEDLNGNNWGDDLFGDGAGLGDLFGDGAGLGDLFDDGAGLGDLFGDGGWDGGLFGDGGGAGGLALPGGDQPVQLPPAVEPFDDFLALMFASAGTGEAPTAPAAESVFPDAGAGAQAALQGLASIGWTTLQAQGAWSREGIPPLGVPETQGLFQALFRAENELVTCGGVWEYVQQHHNTALTTEDIMDLRYRYQQAYDTGLPNPPRKEPKAVPYGKFTSHDVADGISKFYGHEENAKYRGHLPPRRAVIEVGGKTWHIGRWFDNFSGRGVKGPLPGVVVTALGAAGIKIIDHPDHPGFVKTNKQADEEWEGAMRQYLLNHLPIAPGQDYEVVLEGMDTARNVGKHWYSLRSRGWGVSQAGGHAGERAVLEAAGFTFVEVSVPVKEGGAGKRKRGEGGEVPEEEGGSGGKKKRKRGGVEAAAGDAGAAGEAGDAAGKRFLRLRAPTETDLVEAIGQFFNARGGGAW
ncbi:hypothetical protein ACIOWI_37675, partial [Streptomyces sp. NPDC087659]|uniref:hypothetical protein n=1 Tax=Streptomyces sp. NPDC087659 TaxID=3365801 RepID=UPI0037FB62D6